MIQLLIVAVVVLVSVVLMVRAIAPGERSRHARGLALSASVAAAVNGLRSSEFSTGEDAVAALGAPPPGVMWVASTDRACPQPLPDGTQRVAIFVERGVALYCFTDGQGQRWGSPPGP